MASNPKKTSLILDRVDFRYANFNGTNCIGAIFNDDSPRDSLFSGADFTDYNLEPTKISEGDLHLAYLFRIIMPGRTVNNRDTKLVANLFNKKKSSQHLNS
jgi:uncharacterized protein YjbI with pentapeptide repeats